MSNLNYINSSSGDIVAIDSIERELYIDQNLDTEQLLDWIRFNNVAPRYKIYVLYPDETINYEIPLEDILSGGSYNENYQNGQRRSLSFSLYNVDDKYTPNINKLWAGTRLRLDVGIEVPGETVVWFRKGIYIITKIDPSLGTDQNVVQVSASDKFSLFEDKTGTLEFSYEIPEGQEIESVIKSILLTDMGNGYPLDSKEIIYHSQFKGKKTQVTISKSAGETLGSILLDLATQLSAEIFYNSAGILTIVPINEVTRDIDKPVVCTYNFDEGDIGNLNFSFDLSSIINKIIVIGSSNNGGVYRATAVNDDPGSALCYQRIGYRTGSIINDSNITSDVLAQERASYELRSQLILKSSTNITALFNPFLNVNDCLAINCDFFKLVNTRFIIQSLSYSLDYSGTISISICNLENLAFAGGNVAAANYASYDFINPTRLKSAIYVTLGENISSINLQYYNANGEQTTVNVTQSRLFMAQRGREYSWEAIPNEHYSASPSSGSGVVVSDIYINPIALWTIYTINVVKDPHVANIELTYCDANRNYTTTTFTTSGSVSAAESYSYSWIAAANTGYILDHSSGSGVVSDDITVAPQSTPNNYSVSINRGEGVSAVYLSANPSATSGSDYNYFPYASTVYGFAVLDTGFSSRSDWVLISGTRDTAGSKYRISSLTVEAHANTFGTITASRNVYPVYIASGVGVSSPYLSEISTATSGSSTSTSFPYASTVYGFVQLNSGYYAQSDWVLISGTRDTAGSKYRVGDLTVAISGNNFGTQNAIPRTLTLTITKNLHITGIYYKVNGASSWSYTSSSTTIPFDYGTDIYWYATCDTGYTTTYNSSTNYATIYYASSNQTVSPIATQYTYTTGTLPYNISNVTCYRKLYNSSIWSTIESGAAIYPGDRLYFEPVAAAANILAGSVYYDAEHSLEVTNSSESAEVYLSSMTRPKITFLYNNIAQWTIKLENTNNYSISYDSTIYWEDGETHVGWEDSWTGTLTSLASTSRLISADDTMSQAEVTITYTNPGGIIFHDNVDSGNWAYLNVTKNSGVSWINLSYNNASGFRVSNEVFQTSAILLAQTNTSFAWTAGAETGYVMDTSGGNGTVGIDDNVSPTATPNPYPSKGDIINLNLDGNGNKQYRVLKNVSGTIYEVMSMYDIQTTYTNSSSAYSGYYSNSLLKTYLENTLYDTFTTTAKNAIETASFYNPNISYTCTTMASQGSDQSKYYNHVLSGVGSSSAWEEIGILSSNTISTNIICINIKDIVDYMPTNSFTSNDLKTFFYNNTSVTNDSLGLANYRYGNNKYRMTYELGRLRGYTQANSSSFNKFRFKIQIDLSKVAFEVATV